MSKISKTQLFSSYCEMLTGCDAEKISVTQLVKHCRVSRQAFYYHFPGIDELVHWGIGHIAGNALFDGRKNRSFGAAAGAYLKRFFAERDFLLKCMNSKYEAALISHIKSSAKELTALYFGASGESAPGERALFFTDFISSALAMAAYDAVCSSALPAENAYDYLNELAEKLTL